MTGVVILFIVGLACFIGAAVGKEVDIRGVRLPAAAEAKGRLGMALTGVLALGLGLVLYLYPLGGSPKASANSPDNGVPSALGPGQSSGSGDAAATSPSSPSSSFVEEFRNSSFTMPGGACQGGEAFPSGVTFTEQGPQVTTNSGGGDILLGCDVTDSPPGPPSISFTGDQVAEVNGNLTASACDAAVTQHPLVGDVSFPRLHAGTAFCIINSQTDQLVYVMLQSINNSSYDLDWSATGWSAAAGS